jgi:hypothetical protein
VSVPHGWQFGAPFVPEAKESIAEIVRFITRNVGLQPASQQKGDSNRLSLLTSAEQRAPVKDFPVE